LKQEVLDEQILISTQIAQSCLMAKEEIHMSSTQMSRMEEFYAIHHSLRHRRAYPVWVMMANK